MNCNGYSECLYLYIHVCNCDKMYMIKSCSYYAVVGHVHAV